MGGTTQQRQSPFTQSASALSGGIAGLQNMQNTYGNPYQSEAASLFRGAAGPTMQMQTMNSYLNPYQDQVVNNMVERMRQRRANDLSMVRSQAAQSGAYGGARQGLVEAELMDRYAQAENDAISSALQQGFNTSAQLGQNRISQIQGSASGLAGLGGQTSQQMLAASQGLLGAAPTAYNLGNAVLQQQQQAGAAQRAIAQRVMDQAAGQYDTYANYPQQALATALAGLQGNPLAAQQTSTQSYNPGLFDFFKVGMGTYAAGK